MESISKKRLYSLDAMKFVATVLIIFHHYQQGTHVKLSGINFYDGIFYFGYLVELFFILSGFFMGMKIEENSNITFKKFFLGKIIRLYPMCMIATFASLVVSLAYSYIYKSGYAVGIWDVFCAVFNIRGGGYVRM